MKVLGISGSPREGGNTDILLKYALDGISTSGGATQAIFVRELNISPCKGCRSCSQTGECIIQDDRERIFSILKEIDYLILASPIFFYGLPAQLKALIDRTQPAWSSKYILSYRNLDNSNSDRPLPFGTKGGTAIGTDPIRPRSFDKRGCPKGDSARAERVPIWKKNFVPKSKQKRKGLFLAVGATRGKRLFEGAILTVKYFFDAIDIEYHSEVLIRGVDAKGEITHYPQYLEEAYQAGKTLVKK